MRTMDADRRLTDRNALDVEHQVRVGGDIGKSLIAVGKLRGNREAALTPSSDASYTNVPSFDDFADTKLERERLALLVG